MSNDVYEALRLLSDIDMDHMHAVNDPLHPRHRGAVKNYIELAEWCSIELSKRGAYDYPTNVQPPPLKETRKGFMRPP
ncbi:MAG: hypothetical protein QX199_15320 [Methylococcaceae bacterium]